MTLPNDDWKALKAILTRKVSVERWVLWVLWANVALNLALMVTGWVK